VGLSVRPDAGEELVGALRERGFEVRG